VPGFLTLLSREGDIEFSVGDKRLRTYRSHRGSQDQGRLGSSRPTALHWRSRADALPSPSIETTSGQKYHPAHSERTSLEHTACGGSVGGELDMTIHCAGLASSSGTSRRLIDSRIIFEPPASRSGCFELKTLFGSRLAVLRWAIRWPSPLGSRLEQLDRS